MEIRETLEAKQINIDFNNLKIPKNITNTDLSLVELFKKSAKYYRYLADDYPADIKLALVLNNCRNVPHLLMEIPKYVENKRLASMLNKLYNFIQSRM